MNPGQLSYAFVATPGNDFRLFCDDGLSPLRGNDRFVAVPWNESWSNGVVIRDTACEWEPFISNSTGRRPDKSTVREKYLRNIASLVEELKQTGGKTVISALVCGRFGQSPAVVMDNVLEYLFNAPADCYRCLFSTPQTGTWLVVSPETLANIDLHGKILSTMSLAGTRPAGTGGDWDVKNRDEQDMVTQFIIGCLKDNGLTDITAVSGTRQASAVEHIVTSIQARIGEGFDMPALLDSLSPTPALCGLPRAASLHRIAKIEDFPRLMYGGYTAVVEAGRQVTSAVTLRCASLDTLGWTIYTGSGITPASGPEDEWDEIMLKARPIRNLLETLSAEEYHTQETSYERN